MPHTNQAAIDLDWHPLSDDDIRHFDDQRLPPRAECAELRYHRLSQHLRQCNNILFDDLLCMIVVCTRDQFQRFRRKSFPYLLRHATLTAVLRSVA